MRAVLVGWIVSWAVSLAALSAGVSVTDNGLTPASELLSGAWGYLDQISPVQKLIVGGTLLLAAIGLSRFRPLTFWHVIWGAAIVCVSFMLADAVSTDRPLISGTYILPVSAACLIGGIALVVSTSRS
ncbi:MAG: hypothetical protein AAFY84_04640 [Pseudomonadota bacterium]